MLLAKQNEKDHGNVLLVRVGACHILAMKSALIERVKCERLVSNTQHFKRI